MTQTTFDPVLRLRNLTLRLLRVEMVAVATRIRHVFTHFKRRNRGAARPLLVRALQPTYAFERPVLFPPFAMTSAVLADDG